LNLVRELGDDYLRRPVSTMSMTKRIVLLLGLAALLAAAALVVLPGPASAGSLSSHLSAKRHQLQQDRSRQAALSTTIEHYSSRIDSLAAEVVRLQDQEAQVQQQLDRKQAQLQRARARLARVRVRLHKAMKVLKERLVAAYESDRPSTLNVILNSHGFGQLTSRYTYIQAIEHQDATIVSNVRTLRNEVRNTVDRIHAARDRLAAKRDELVQTQKDLRARQSQLSAAHDRKQRLLSKVKANGEQLQKEISDIQSKIAAAQAAAQQAVGSGAIQVGPALSTELGPIPPGQAISPFPASSPLTWGRTDQGVDGTTAPGTPLLAMGSGTVTIGHDPGGFGDSYPILQTSFGSYYYGHCVPIVGDGASVHIGEPIATAHYGTWGNSTTPGGFEIGQYPPGDMAAGGAIRAWLIALPRR
jgi:peptidoglycan hydrolase CwlO-like protein